MADDAFRTVGDDISEDAIVVDSATDQPVLLDPAQTTTTSRVVDVEDTTNFAAIPDTTADATAGTEAEAGLVSPAMDMDGANITDPEQVIAPARFDRDEVFALIDDAEKLTDEQRPARRALVESASAYPAMVEPAIASIRTALDLPPLTDRTGPSASGPAASTCAGTGDSSAGRWLGTNSASQRTSRPA